MRCSWLVRLPFALSMLSLGFIALAFALTTDHFLLLQSPMPLLVHLALALALSIAVEGAGEWLAIHHY